MFEEKAAAAAEDSKGKGTDVEEAAAMMLAKARCVRYFNLDI
jgi:hypothetical protein